MCVARQLLSVLRIVPLTQFPPRPPVDFKRARMLTSIHARPEKRPQLASNANATNLAVPHEGGGDAQPACDRAPASDAAKPPPAKKADRKTSLKRL